MNNIKSRIRKVERETAIVPGAKSSLGDSWLKTLTDDELHFLLQSHESEEFREANAAKFKEYKEKFDEYKKQIKNG